MFMMLLMTLSFSAIGSDQNLEVVIEEMKNTDGHVLYLLFNNEEGFPDKPQKSFKQGKVLAKEAQSGFLLKDLPPGSYALSIIHDENDNDKLDKNFLGMPKEGVGFSNNPKMFFGPPGFKKCEFKVTEGTNKINIKLVHF